MAAVGPAGNLDDREDGGLSRHGVKLDPEADELGRGLFAGQKSDGGAGITGQPTAEVF